MHQDNVDIHIRLEYSDVESRGHYTKEDIIYSKKDIKNQTYLSNIECGEIQYIKWSNMISLVLYIKFARFSNVVDVMQKQRLL